MKVGLDEFDKAPPEFRYWVWVWSCIVVVEDAEDWLRRSGAREAGDDKDKREAVNKKLREFRKARGSAEDRARTGEKALKRIDEMRTAFPDLPGPRTINHMVYHVANTKKLVIAHWGNPDAVGPVKAWKLVECQGADCRLETEAEKKHRERQGR